MVCILITLIISISSLISLKSINKEMFIMRVAAKRIDPFRHRKMRRKK